MSRRVAALALVLAMAAGPALADSPLALQRRVAVVAVREGSAELPDVAERITALLTRRTSLQVIGVDAARASYGAAFDAHLVACAGQPECLAKLGTRLGVARVLLVAVSEFGDVILTLQLIEASGGRVAGRIAEALAPGSRPTDAALFRYLERLLPADDFRRYGILKVIADVTGASVVVGGVARGQTPLRPLKLAAPASYDILVRKSGYLDFRASVAVPPEAEVLVRPQLSRRAERPAWYQKWWVLAAVGTVAAGAVTTAFIVSRSGDDEVPVRIEPF